MRLTADGQACLDITTCGRLGLGFWFGVEVVVGGGVSMYDGLGAGGSPWSIGIGADIGTGGAWGAGFSTGLGDGSASFSTGRSGGGAGLWAGGELCHTESHCTSEYTPD